MTDLEKYDQRRSIIQKNSKIVNAQKEILADLLEKQNNYLSTCPHQFILYLGNQILLDDAKSFYVCLCCDKTIVSNKDNLNFKDKNIIDISDFIEQTTLHETIIQSSNHPMILKARETLDQLAKEEKNNQEYNIDFVKESIRNSLTEYTELINQTSNGKSQIRERKKAKK